MEVLQYFGKGYNCAQSVLAANADAVGLDEDICKRISASFGGGIGGRQQVCGAVTGALMVIGMWYFRDENPAKSKAIVKERSDEFIKEFTRENGSETCRDLLGTSMEEAREAGYFETKCNNFVEAACRILVDLKPE